MTPAQAATPVSHVMTSHVRTVGPQQTLREVWQLLQEERCHHVPVVLAGRAIGMISSRDLVRVARKHGARQLAEVLDGHEVAADLMSSDLQTIGVDEPVDVAIDRIGEGDLHALVVVDEEGRLAGIVTHHDLLHYLAR